MTRFKIATVLILLTWLGMSFLEKAEKEGIEFQSISLAEAKALALKENKLIFIDAYATWCGPCKMLDKTSFKDKSVGKVYNQQFINLKLDAENSEDGRFVAKAYRVNAYPTLLFINGKGKLVKSFVGYRDSGDLLNMSDIVLE